MVGRAVTVPPLPLSLSMSATTANTNSVSARVQRVRRRRSARTVLQSLASRASRPRAGHRRFPLRTACVSRPRGPWRTQRHRRAAVQPLPARLASFSTASPKSVNVTPRDASRRPRASNALRASPLTGEPIRRMTAASLTSYVFPCGAVTALSLQSAATSRPGAARRSTPPRRSCASGWPAPAPVEPGEVGWSA